MEYYNRLKSYIMQEVKNIYISQNWMLTIRILSLLLGTSFLLQSALYFFSGFAIHGAVSLFCSLLFYYSFHMTYGQHVKAANLWNITNILIWIVFCVLSSGWDTGVQHFIFLLIVLIFFADYGNINKKCFFVLLLFLLRISLYLYCKTKPPIIPLNTVLIDVMQFTNTFLIFTSITIVTICFSNKSQDMEKKLIEYSKSLETEANCDSLTGLYNRRMLQPYVQNCLQQYQTSGRPFSIAIGDIDFFKKVNDTYGHDYGDFVLQELAGQFTQFLCQRGRTFRYGGEEFVLIFENMNGDEASEALSALMLEIRNKDYSCKNDSFHIHMTFGLAEYDYDLNWDRNIKKIDDLLYKGKKSGRNKIIY